MCRCFVNRPVNLVPRSSRNRWKHSRHGEIILFQAGALRSQRGSSSCFSVQVLSWLTMGVLVSVGLEGSALERVREIDPSRARETVSFFPSARMKARFPYASGGWVTIERKGFPRPEWSRARGEGGGRRARSMGPLRLVLAYVACSDVVTGSCSPRRGMARHSGTMRVVAVLL